MVIWLVDPGGYVWALLWLYKASLASSFQLHPA